MDAGFLTVVEVGQYFMTKDTEEFTDSVACREYTLPRDEDSSEPKGWIRGNTKIGPVLEVTTCCLRVKYGVAIRIMSVNKDNSHSWDPVSKKLIYLLRHGSPPRDNDGAIEFWRIKDYHQDHFVFCHHCSDDTWKKHGKRRRKQEKIPVL